MLEAEFTIRSNESFQAAPVLRNTGYLEGIERDIKDIIRPINYPTTPVHRFESIILSASEQLPPPAVTIFEPIQIGPHIEENSIEIAS